MVKVPISDTFVWCFWIIWTTEVRTACRPECWPKTSCWLNLMVPKKWKYLWLEGRLRGVVFFPQPLVTTLESNVAPPSNVETIPSSRSPSSRLEPHFGGEKPTCVYRFMLRYWIHMLPSKVLSLPRHEPNTSKVELDPYMPWCCGPVNLWALGQADAHSLAPLEGTASWLRWRPHWNACWFCFTHLTTVTTHHHKPISWPIL